MGQQFLATCRARNFALQFAIELFVARLLTLFLLFATREFVARGGGNTGNKQSQLVKPKKYLVARQVAWKCCPCYNCFALKPQYQNPCSQVIFDTFLIVLVGRISFKIKASEACDHFPYTRGLYPLSSCYYFEEKLGGLMGLKKLCQHTRSKENISRYLNFVLYTLKQLFTLVLVDNCG